MSRDRALLAGTLSAVVAATIFGMLGPLARFGAEAGVDGVAFTAWRGGLGVVALAALVAARGRTASSIRAVRGLPARGRLALGVATAMGLTLNASVFSAFGLIPIALALMLFYTYPAGVVVVDLALGRERLTAQRVVALGLSSAGVALVLVGGSPAVDGGPVNPLGIALGLAAAASQVVFVSVSRHGYSDVPADAATLLILLVSAVGGSVLAVVVGQGPSLVAPFGSAEPWPFLLLGGVVAAALSSLLFLRAIRTIGGTRTGILMLLEPVVGALLAGLWLGETLAPVQFLGGGLVLAGALVLQLGTEPADPPVVETDAAPAA